MLLESFIAMYGISFFATKAIYTKLDKSKEIHEEALNQGLYHITSEENCDKILKSGHMILVPVKYSLNKKVFNLNILIDTLLVTSILTSFEYVQCYTTERIFLFLFWFLLLLIF